MYFRTQLLHDTLDQYHKIIIYGTGDYAQEIYPQLVQCGLKKKIFSFTQTIENETKEIDGIPVLCIKDIDLIKTDCVVLIAVSKAFVDEIKHTLLEMDYLNIVSLIDYGINYSLTEADFRNLLTFEEYCESIADWYAKTHMGNPNNRIIFQKLMNRGDSVHKNIDTELIVIISGHLSPRTTRIITALKKKKYKVILLSYSRGENNWCAEELKKTNVQMYKCRRIEEMLYEALQYCPLVYYFEPSWGDCSWAEIMFKNKRYFGKVVLALYDVLNDGYVGETVDNLATEKYVLEQADGIVWRWFSKEQLIRKGFDFPGKSIQFIDYCCYDDINLMKYDQVSTVVKLCAVSAYGDEYVDERVEANKYTEWARIGEILEKIGNREDCIFHFYAGTLSDINVALCRQYEKEYKNFKFFLGTGHDELLQRLQRYDYGCELWTAGEKLLDDTPIGEYYGSCYYNSIRNAFFDFFSVEMPIVTTQASKLWEYLSAYDLVVSMDLDNLDIDYLREHREYYKDQVRLAKEELNIDNQISRLIQFFKEV